MLKTNKIKARIHQFCYDLNDAVYFDDITWVNELLENLNTLIRKNKLTQEHKQLILSGGIINHFDESGEVLAENFVPFIKQSPLHIAYNNQNEEIAQKLIAAGANQKLIDLYGLRAGDQQAS